MGRKNEFVDFLEEVKKKNGIRFDTDLAKFLGMTRTNLSKITQGRGLPGDDTCIQIANATGCDPAYVLALVHKVANKSPNAVAVWDRVLRNFPKPVFFWMLIGGWLMGSGVTGTIPTLDIMSTFDSGYNDFPTVGSPNAPG